MIGNIAKEYIEKPIDDLLFEAQILSFGQTAQKEIKHTLTQDEHSTIKFRATKDDIFKNFLRRDTTGRYRSYDKAKILKDLWEKQDTQIIFMHKEGDELVLFKRKLYTFDEIMLLPCGSEYYFSINTFVLRPRCSSKDYYVHLNLKEFKKIDQCLKEYWDPPKHKRIIKYLRSNKIFRAMPTKLNMLLKYRYNSARNFKDIKSGYEGNFCEISDEDIGKFLGNIDNEIVRILMTNNYMGDNHKDLRDNKLFNQMRNYIIWAAFYCARKLGWIVSNPPKNKKGNWRFNLNRYYFTGKIQKRINPKN